MYIHHPNLPLKILRVIDSPVNSPSIMRTLIPLHPRRVVTVFLRNLVIQISPRTEIIPIIHISLPSQSPRHHGQCAKNNSATNTTHDSTNDFLVGAA